MAAKTSPASASSFAPSGQAAGNQQVLRALGIRAKLEISRPQDPEEREADRAADAFSAGSLAPPIPRDGGNARVHRACAGCEDQTALLRRKAGDGAPGTAATASVSRAMERSRSESLAPSLRKEYESFFGADLSGIRVHTDHSAQEAASAASSHAFARGPDLFFAAGRFDPSSTTGRKLLAHELTHAVQESRSSDDNEPVIRRQEADTEFAREIEEERQLRDWPLRLDLAAGWDLGAAVHGPLAPGAVVDDHGLVVTQHDVQRVTIQLGDHRIEISAPSPDVRYAFWVEPLALPRQRTLSTVLGGGYEGIMLHMPGEEQRVQRVVRIAASYRVRVNTPYYFDDERPELVAQVRWAAPEDVDPMSEMLVSPWVREVPLNGGAVQLELDDTRIRISPPGSERGFQGGDFAAPRFAYWLDPAWSGPNRDEKIAYVVASPGVRVELAEPMYRMAISNYGRKLVPVVLRVPHPSMVPAQGAEINPSDYIGDQPVREQESGLALFGGTTEPPSVRAISGLSGGVTIAHESGAMVSIRPVDPNRGAAFAYQAIPDDNFSITEVRIVVGPDVFVEVIEPVTAEGMPEHFQKPGEGFRGAGFQVEIVEVDSAALVPPQGTPLNLYYYLGYGRWRKPDQHRWMDTSTALYDVQTAVLEGAIGFIPIVGDLADFAHFGYALATGRDVWGHELTAVDKIVMGIGAVIGLIPIIGDIVKSGMRAAAKGARIAMDLATAAARLGTTPEIAEVLVHRLTRVASGDDAAAISRVNTAFRAGSDIDPDDLDRIAGVLRRLGASDQLLGGSRFGRQTGLVLMQESDEAARIGRRAPEVDDWYRGLNRETREMLHGDPGLARAYEEMDAGVRRLLTRCGSGCVPSPAPTRAQQDRILAFAQSAGLEPGSFTERRVRAYLQVRRANLDEAITALERKTSPAALARFLGRDVANADVVLLQRPILRTRATTRAAVDDAIAAGIDVEQLARIMDVTRETGIAGERMLGYVTQLARLRRSGIGGVDDVLADLSRGGNWARGAEWMLRYCDARGWRGISGFEVVQSTALGGIREIDAVINGVRYQFKSWSNFYPSTFVRQIEKDFDLVQGNLRGGLRWVFDPRKPLRDPEAIRAAAAQALDDALARGTTRLNAREVERIKLALESIIEVP
jgi:hypothetical protein